jgi:CIC family chloride channel protein
VGHFRKMSELGQRTSRTWSKTQLLHRLTKLQPREDQVFLVLALVIGALTGLAVVAFIVLTERMGMRLYPAGGAPWRRLLLPVVGSLGIGYLLFRYFPYARGSGVPQTKAALYAREGRITLRTVLGKFFCTSATLASGIPLGREGPSVQVGAGIASVLGRLLGLRPEKVKALLPVGAAAAIAAAFNTPLAAVLFALEENSGGPSCPGAGLGRAGRRYFLGGAPPSARQQPFIQGSAIPTGSSRRICRVCRARTGRRPGVGGLHKTSAGHAATFSSSPAKDTLVSTFGRRTVSRVGGMVCAPGHGRGLWIRRLRPKWKHGAKADGSPRGSEAHNGDYELRPGNAGGIFGPALFIGAMLGGSLGTFAHRLFPAYTAMPGAYALVGMGAVFAGIVRAPMTSVLMIFEMTQDYAVIVPLMIANLVSLFVSSRLQGQPIYEALAIQDGIHLPTAEARQRHDQRHVVRVMRTPTALLPTESTVREALEQVHSSEFRTWLVADRRGVIGVISRSRLEQELAEGSDKKLGELVDALDFPHVHSDQGLDLALERMGTNQIEILPVVSRADVHKLEGVVTLRDVLDSYGVHLPGRA